MSFEDCVQRGMDGDEVRKEFGKYAQKLWREIADEYELQGHSRHMAEAMAGEDVKVALKKQQGQKRHHYIAQMATIRNIDRRVAEAPDTAKLHTQSVEQLDYRSRGLVRRFNARLGAFLKDNHRTILGNLKDPAQMRSIVRELHGEASGDATAKLLADAIRDALEDMRLMANEAGASIGQQTNWGLRHSHNRMALAKAGFDKWFQAIDGRIDWTRIDNNVTGRPFDIGHGPPPLAVRQRFLKEIYRNIRHGRGSDEPTYGAVQGAALYRSLSRERVLVFKSADDWTAYNKDFGNGTPFSALMAHVHSMARDISAMRQFGPNPTLGLDYQVQLTRKDASLDAPEGFGDKLRKFGDNGEVAKRMLKVQMGGVESDSLAQQMVATFFSSTRHGLTGAFLDRAILSSVSDLNSMRLAAQAIGMNPANVISRHVDLMANSMTREDALRAGWVADTLADPGSALARFQQEVPPAEVFERMSHAVIRAQGLAYWTDQARIAFQMEMAGYMAAHVGKGLDDLPPALRGALQRAGLTDAEWRAFTDASTLYKAGNGATFASPMWWREATDLPRRQADLIFDKVQGVIEEQMEYAVPTQSLLARSFVDPAAYDMPPGSIPYELMKSGTMFKSFAMSFTTNQVRRIMAQPTVGGRILYGMDMAAGATVMGMFALQLSEIAKGNDPLDMTDPKTWPKAALKGGGFGIVGDLVATGATSWGGGFESYASGPIPQLMGDAYDLAFKNAWELATGQETNFVKEFADAGKRYTPGGQLAPIGPAIDRLFWDSLQKALDPDAQKELNRRATARENRDGNAEWWMPGSALPDRAPNPGAALGL